MYHAAAHVRHVEHDAPSIVPAEEIGEARWREIEAEIARIHDSIYPGDKFGPRPTYSELDADPYDADDAEWWAEWSDHYRFTENMNEAADAFVCWADDREPEFEEAELSEMGSQVGHDDRWDRP